MQYRNFGKLKWKASALGFGAMRLPIIGNDQSNVDHAESIRMIRYAIDQGINYLDTGYPYHNGQSERVVGLALKDGYRQKMKLATKLPARMVEKPEDFDRFLSEQLDRLQMDKLDFYLLHGLTAQSWPKVRDFGIIPWAEKKMSQGLFDYLGFSFHDNYDTFKVIIDSYDNWTLSQIQYNYVDVNNQAGRRGVEYAASKGLAIVVMEPIRGGRLSRKPPERVAEAWGNALNLRTQAEWALSWVWNQPEISLALSGMSNMEQVKENLASAEKSRVQMLSSDDLARIDRVREAYQNSNPVPCTSCNYCQPCQNGVAIPGIFEIYNEAIVYGETRQGRANYQGFGPRGLKPEQRADQCIECGTCVEACPQKIAIPEWLKKAHTFLGPKPINS